MSGEVPDFAVFGSSPLAMLLAGLLSGAHGKSVLLIGESQASYRLPRAVDLSVAPITRPESWSLLGEAVPETLRLLGRIVRRGGWSRVDPLFFAAGAAPREALSHIRHMAQGFGFAAEPVAPSLLGQGRAGFVVRDAVRLNRAAIEPALDRWLLGQKVWRLAPQRVTIHPEGAAELLVDGAAITARQAILCDDDAIMSWLPLRQWPTLLRRQPSASILSTPARVLPAPVMVELDTGLVAQQLPEGGIVVSGPGDLAHLARRLPGFLGAPGPFEQAGQTRFTSLATTDGAPVFGRAGGTGADVITALGPTGTFLAPALARWLAGSASARESEWFGARLANRADTASTVGDYCPPDREHAA